MSLIFFGKHSQDWMNILNNGLLTDLQQIDNELVVIDNYYVINENLKNCKYLIPLIEKHMLELYKNNIDAIMPSIESINYFRCKQNFYNYVKKNNLLDYIPKTYENILEIKNNINNLFILKPFNYNNGFGMLIVKNIYPKYFIDYIIQEYIPNNSEYAAHIISDKGKIIYNITYNYTFTNLIHINSSKLLKKLNKITLDDKYILILEKFLIPCEYTGVCCVDFIIVNDNIKVFEINPRFGGSLMKNKTDLIIMFSHLLKLKKSL